MAGTLEGPPPSGTRSVWGLGACPPIWQAYQQAVIYLETWRGTEATAIGGQGPPSSFGQLVSFHLSSISGGPAVYPLIFTIALLGGGT